MLILCKIGFILIIIVFIYHLMKCVWHCVEALYKQMITKYYIRTLCKK